jgi:hypothetical protein
MMPRANSMTGDFEASLCGVTIKSTSGIVGRCSFHCIAAATAIPNMIRPIQSNSRQSLDGALELSGRSGAGSRKPILRDSSLCV